MTIASEFLKGEEPVIGDVEDNILFIIDNYGFLLELYRVMQAQEEETKKKKEEAHSELEALRDREEQITKSGKKLNKQERMELEERKKYLMDLREEDDDIYFHGEKLAYTQYTRLILKHQKIFKMIDELDRAGRSKFAVIAQITSTLFLWPTSKMLSITIEQTKNKKVLDLLESSKIVLDGAPQTIKEKIMANMEVDLKKHKPKKKKDKDTIEIVL